MRGWPVALSLVVIVAIVGAAYLYVASFPACGCGARPAPFVGLSRVDDATTGAWTFQVEAASPGLTYGGIALELEGERLAFVEGRAAGRGEWSAWWGDLPLVAANTITAGDVVQGEDVGELRVLDFESNAYVAFVAVRGPDHLA